MDIVNTLTVNIGRIIYNLSSIWIGLIMGIVIIAGLPVRSIMQKVDEIGSMLEDYDKASKKDKSKYIPILYDLIDQFYESKLPEPEYYWDAKSNIDPPSGDGINSDEPSDEDMMNMDYPESKQLHRTPNATNLLYLEAAAHLANTSRNLDMGDSLALAISQMIANRQAGPALRRHRQRNLPANLQDEYYTPELVTILAPPSERPPTYFYYIVDRRTLPADFQNDILIATD